MGQSMYARTLNVVVSVTLNIAVVVLSIVFYKELRNLNSVPVIFQVL